MRKYEDEIEIAECLINEARTYVDHATLSEEIVPNDYYDDIEKLNLTEEDKELYRIRLGLVFYRNQF